MNPKTSLKFKRKLEGKVVNSSLDKTIVVSVTRKFKHLTYSKFITRSKKYHAHDNDNIAKVGDAVIIIESKPFSKLKKWALLKVN